MNKYVIVRRSAWADAAALERAASRASRVCIEDMPERVRWLRTYICEEDDGTLAGVCVYEASDPEALREHARRAKLACDLVLPIARTVLIDDEAPESQPAETSRAP
jgi:uncharacterized protein DUF4242